MDIEYPGAFFLQVFIAFCRIFHYVPYCFSGMLRNGRYGADAIHEHLLIERTAACYYQIFSILLRIFVRLFVDINKVCDSEVFVRIDNIDPEMHNMFSFGECWFGRGDIDLFIY